MTLRVSESGNRLALEFLVWAERHFKTISDTLDGATSSVPRSTENLRLIGKMI